MKNPITKKISEHLAFLGYRVKEIAVNEGEKVESDFLGAESESKSNITVRIFKDNLILISARYDFSDSNSVVTQKFLDALNSENAKSMYSKVYYREKEDKKVVLEIESSTVGYEKQAFVTIIDLLEKEVGMYLKDLKEYYSEK